MCICEHTLPESIFLSLLHQKFRLSEAVRLVEIRVNISHARLRYGHDYSDQ